MMKRDFENLGSRIPAKGDRLERPKRESSYGSEILCVDVSSVGVDRVD